MQWHSTAATALVAAIAAFAADASQAQVRRFVTPPDQVIAIRAGHLFDSKTRNMLANQMVLVRGDRIVDVGPSVAIPAGATIIDLSQATVMPGMIDAHVHVNTGGASLAMRAITAATQRALLLDSAVAAGILVASASASSKGASGLA